MIILDFSETDLTHREAVRASNYILRRVKYELVRNIPTQKLRAREEYVKKFIELKSGKEIRNFSLINLVEYFIYSLGLISESYLVYRIRLSPLVRVPGTNVSLWRIIRLLEYGNEDLMPLYYYRSVVNYYQENYLSIAYKLLGRSKKS